MRTSGMHPGTFPREVHGMVPSKQFCVWVVRGDFWSVNLQEILIDKSAGSMQGIVVTHLTVDFIGDSSDSSSETVKIASCGSPIDCH